MPNAHGEDDTAWRHALALASVSQPLVDAIMDPVFKDLRLTADAQFWTTDTFDMRYASLKAIQRASRARSMEQARGGGGHRRAKSTATSTGNIASTSSTAFGHTRGSRSVSSVQQQTTPGTPPIPWTLDLYDQLPYNSVNIVLFRGIDEARMNGLFDEQGQLARLERIISSAPSDFSGKRGRYYFTDNRNVAEYYASYAKRRGNCESVCMIAVTIPRDQIEALFRASNADTNGDDAAQKLRAYDLRYPSPQWKQLVWRSKRATTLPTPLQKYCEALLLVGTTTKGDQKVFLEMDHWEMIDQRCVLSIRGPDGRKKEAVQYVFSDEEEADEFLIK